MDKIRLGITELDVTPLAFGTWQLGGDWGDFDQRDATAAIRRALELGINVFDTAQAYGFGASERLLGHALRSELRQQRDELVIATKGGLRMTGDGLVRDSSPAWLREGVEDSLRALGLDHIDLYQVHWPDPDGDVEEAWTTFAELKAQGLVRHIGVSNFNVAQMRRAQAIAPVETLQPPYSLLERAIEDEILPFAAREGIGVIPYSPMASGLLTGAMTAERVAALPDDDWRKHDARFQEPQLSRHLALVARLQEVAERHDTTAGAIAVAWTLHHPAVHGSIVGFRRPEQVEPLASAGNIDLTEEDLAIIAGA
jgi:aryl-alcohol dehydrogenase-like predicted oxidoreductase